MLKASKSTSFRLLYTRLPNNALVRKLIPFSSCQRRSNYLCRIHDPLIVLEWSLEVQPYPPPHLVLDVEAIRCLVESFLTNFISVLSSIAERIPIQGLRLLSHMLVLAL